MTIGILERIATALEALVALGARPSQPISDNASSPEASAPEVKKPARGRPAKITTEQKETATDAKVDLPVDDFLETPAPKAAKPATLEEVRAALQAYSAKKGGGPAGTTEARTLMTKSSSNGAVRLNVAKDVPGGDQGVLLPADYAAVIAAALA